MISLLLLRTKKQLYPNAYRRTEIFEDMPANAFFQLNSSQNHYHDV